MIKFEKATIDDIDTIIALLADDPLGHIREDASLAARPCYLKAFAAIESDTNNMLVAIKKDNRTIGCLQLTFISYLTHKGSMRCLIEGVRVHKDYRGQKIGQTAFEWAIAYAKTKGCNMVQLTTDKSRPDALKFYEKLGFIASHEGMKLHLKQ